VGCAVAYIIIPLALVVFIGAAAQRVTGLGFALMASPLLVLMVGPFEGVLLANMLALPVSATVLATSWRDVDARRALLLVPAGLVGVWPGVYTACNLPAGPLQVIIGLLILVGLASALVGPRLRFTATSGNTLGAGMVSGFMTATAAVGGPALTFYAITTEWEHRRFAATAQISFAIQAVLALLLKGFAHIPGVVPTIFLLIAIAAGLWFGQLATGHIPPERARKLTVFIALAGAVAATVKGALSW
jgi:uncharacterized membrane protein YfcA